MKRSLSKKKCLLREAAKAVEMLSQKQKIQTSKKIQNEQEHELNLFRDGLNKNWDY